MLTSLKKQLARLQLYLFPDMIYTKSVAVVSSCSQQLEPVLLCCKWNLVINYCVIFHKKRTVSLVHMYDVNHMLRVKSVSVIFHFFMGLKNAEVSQNWTIGGVEICWVHFVLARGGHSRPVSERWRRYWFVAAASDSWWCLTAEDDQQHYEDRSNHHIHYTYTDK